MCSDTESRNLLAGSGAETQDLIDSNAISCDSGDEGSTIAKLSRVAVEFHVGA